MEDERNVPANKKAKSKRKLTKDEKNKLSKAIEVRNIEEAKKKIDIMEDVNQESIFGESVLTLCCYYGVIDLARYLLIELGADANKTDDFGNSPLMKASESGYTEIVRLLINAGADINYFPSSGYSALSWAAYSNHLDIFELLVSSGVNIDICGGMALIWASTNRNIKIVERLIELNVDVNFINPQNGFTTLHYVCRINLELVELFMNNGADETIKDNYEKTPIEVSENEEIKEFIRNYNSMKYVLK